jgi:hypothetical protein
MSKVEGVINPKYLNDEFLNKLSSQFENASPFPYVILDDFFTAEVADVLFDKFPTMENLMVKRKSLNENKVEDYHFERWDPMFEKARQALASKEWSDKLATVTGIPDMRTTDDNMGSGLHQCANAGYVDVHIDVNVNTKEKLWRRVNLLVYLNKYWKPEYGGDLEIWDKDMTKCHAEVSPGFNKAILFLTDDNSPHGVKAVNVPEGESRKSMYTYYFTPMEEGVTYRDSVFIPRPTDSISKKVMTSTKEKLKISVKKALFALGIKSLDFQDKNKKE